MSRQSLRKDFGHRQGFVIPCRVNPKTDQGRRNATGDQLIRTAQRPRSAPCGNDFTDTQSTLGCGCGPGGIQRGLLRGNGRTPTAGLHDGQLLDLGLWDVRWVPNLTRHLDNGSFQGRAMTNVEGNPVGRFKTPREGSLLPSYPSGDAIVGSFSGNLGESARRTVRNEMPPFTMGP